jgi:hypothetical protein
MTRRAVLAALVDAARFRLLRLRVTLGRPLPAALMALMAWLDRMAVRVERGRR